MGLPAGIHRHCGDELFDAEAGAATIATKAWPTAGAACANSLANTTTDFEQEIFDCAAAGSRQASCQRS